MASAVAVLGEEYRCYINDSNYIACHKHMEFKAVQKDQAEK